MRKTIAFGILLILLALTACGQPTLAAEPTQNGEPIGLPNPWRDITEAEAKKLCPGSLGAPEGAENVQWSALESEGEPPLVQLCFVLNGYLYTAREQVTNDKTADISGVYYNWTEQIEITMKNWENGDVGGTYFRYIGEDEWDDLCIWFEAEKGISYSLSVTSKDLDGFDLQAIAEALFAPSESAAETARQDGERFEATILLEGMEETVPYEHIINDTIGVEMDYDYERFERHSESDRECFVSRYDAPEDPQNYLELVFIAEDADTVSASVSEALSKDYEIIRESFVLERAGNCVRIDASNAKGGKGTPDLLQEVYIIPATDGCLVATAHYTYESAEGFGARFSYFMNTLAVIDRRIDTASGS